MMQPRLTGPVVDPDLILVPLIAIDGRGTRLGRGKGHYDRALARLRKSGARLIGVGWPLQRLADAIPPTTGTFRSMLSPRPTGSNGSAPAPGVTLTAVRSI